MTKGLSESAIREGLGEALDGCILRLFQTIDSTNSLAKRESAKTGCNTEIIISDTQREGRGRGDHKWESPCGVGLYLSLLSFPRVKNSTLPAMNLVAGIAASQAIYKETGMKVSLKWPNDIFMDDKKLGGILLEKGYNNALVTGIGLNINNEESDFPEYLKGRATSLYLASSVKYDRNRIVASFIASFYSLCNALETEPGKVVDAWKELSSTIGKRVTVKEGGTIRGGIAVDVDTLGFLLLRDDSGKIAKITSGEICCSQ